MEDVFTCNIDGQTTLEVCGNADGDNALVTVSGTTDTGLSEDTVSIALSARQAKALAYTLNVYAAGLE